MRIPFLGGIGVPELIIILIVVLLIFGPKNLPKLGNAIGRTFKSMRDGMDGDKKKEEVETKATEVENSSEELVTEVQDAEGDAAEASKETESETA